MIWLPGGPDWRISSGLLSADILGADMAINLQRLERAAEALEARLRAEADAQNAYLFKFPDGRVSLELEWIDLRAIARGVVTAYGNGRPSRRSKP